MAPNATKELDLIPIEKQLVMLAIQKRVAGNQQAAQMRAQADQIEAQCAANFSADTAPISEGRKLPEGCNPFFDMRPDGKTMFVRFEVPTTGPALVKDEPEGPDGPADVLD